MHRPARGPARRVALVIAASAPGEALHQLDQAVGHGAHLARQLLAYRPYIPLAVLFLSLGAAAAFGASSVLQQREAHRAPSAMAMRLGLIGHLLRRPLWLLGNLAGIVGYGLQFLALRRGSLALVQPLLVTGLVFALGGAALLDRRRPSWGDVLWTVTTMGGLALFIAVAQPGPGVAAGSSAGWAALGLVAGGLVAALVIAARRWRRWRALSLGVAAGVLGGVLSALIERTAHELDRGVAHTFASWAPYGLVACALLSIVLTQSAYQAGDLRLSLPALTVSEPIAAILISQLLLGEQIASGTGAVVGEVLGLSMMALGVFGLGQAAAPAAAAAEPQLA